MTAAILLTIQVGRPTRRGVENAEHPMDQPWTSGFVKEPVSGPVWLGRTNLADDGQADLKNHGGSEKAVLAYSASHYPTWSTELGRDLPYGAFGENFTIESFSESSVCIGDVYEIGGAIVQVSQPRVPCWKISRRWRIEGLDQKVKISGRSGWYLRVLQEGYVEASQTIRLVERSYDFITVSLVNDIIHGRITERESIETVIQCKALTAKWRDIFHQKLIG